MARCVKIVNYTFVFTGWAFLWETDSCSVSFYPTCYWIWFSDVEYSRTLFLSGPGCTFYWFSWVNWTNRRLSCFYLIAFSILTLITFSTSDSGTFVFGDTLSILTLIANCTKFWARFQNLTIHSLIAIRLTNT